MFEEIRAFSEAMSKLYKLKEEQIARHRKEAQNRPSVKRRKSEAMKKYWEEKKRKEKEVKEEQEYINSLTKEERYSSCTCFLGNPPCTYCTDTNYCEDCNTQTWEDKCPNCGRNLVGANDVKNKAI